MESGLTSIGIISPTIDEGLQMSAIFHLSFVLFLEILVSLRFCRVELSEVPIESMSSRNWQFMPHHSLPLVVIESTRVLMDYISCNSIPNGSQVEFDIKCA